MSPSKSGTEIRRLIEQLADAIRIDDLAERLGIPVKRIGGRLSAQCIFHNDTNPSMVLYPGAAGERPHYHCFVCDAHGDIFELTKQAKGLDFSGAIHWLASSYGLASPALGRPIPSKEPQPSTGQAKVDLAATNAGVFERALAVYKQKNNPALESWLESRELPTVMAAAAELGFADPATLVSYVDAGRQDFGSFRELLGQWESVGLVRSERKKLEAGAAETYLDLGSQYRDFFNDGRVIFPIRDAQERLIGFAGRKTKESNAPKYLYSPNLPKAQLLYRVGNAFSKIRADLADGARPLAPRCL